MGEIISNLSLPDLIKYSLWILLCSGIVFEITPIKINPISFILKWLGNKLNGDIREQLDRVEKENDMRRMRDLKSEVLAFSRSLKRFDSDGIAEDFDSEDYDRIFEAFDEYMKLIKKYSMINGKTIRAMTLINNHSEKRGYGSIKVD